MRNTIVSLTIKLRGSLKTYSTKLYLKNISGWSNYSCTVISYKIIEREIGNRGSKSVFNNTVKEQRVDGSCCRDE